MVQKNPSDRQLEMLRRAEEAEIYEIPRILMNLTRMEEPLDPAWRQIWETNKREIEEADIVPMRMLSQIDRKIEAIPFIDDEIKNIHLDPSDKVCLLLGAGASAGPPSSIPTVAHLLPELWRRAGKLGRDDIDRLAEWCQSNEVSNIEDLLTAAHLANFSAKNASVTGLLDYFMFRAGRSQDGASSTSSNRRVRAFSRVDSSSIALLQDTLQVLFGLLTGTMIPAPPNKGHAAVAKFVRGHPNSSIVTTNYDGCVDEALIRSKVRLNTYVEDSNKPDEKRIDLIKIHGSINWSYCDSCHQVREFPLLELKQSYDADSTSYAVIGICRHCGGQRRPLLIPPMGLKFIIFPNLIQLWNAARESLEEAAYILVVGFSFSEADTYINKIIERSMTRNSEQKLIICDPDSRLVPNIISRFAARIDGFDETRVLSIIGSSDQLLPGVLHGFTPRPKPRAKKKPPQTRKKRSSNRAAQAA